MSAMGIVTCLLVAFSVVGAGRGAGRPPPVEVLKCCRIGETLVDADTCEPGATGTWVPLVYAPKLRSYLTVGTVPAHWTVLEAKRPECPNGVRPQLLRYPGVQRGFILFANGSLWVQDRSAENQLMDPGTYCVDKTAALACPEEEYSDATQSQPVRGLRVRKCCGGGLSWDEENARCVTAAADASTRLLAELRAAAGGIEILMTDGFPSCAEDKFALEGRLQGATLGADGALRTPSGGRELDADEYCVEWVEAGAAAAVVACPRSDGPVVASTGDVRFVLYGAGLAVSALFLAATLAAGFALPSGHHALHWRCQTHYVACLLLGDILLAATHLTGHSIPTTACVTIAICMHFFFLAAFFWLNTMCFNIWWTFRDFRPTSLEKSQEVCRLRVYEVYAWGGPLLIAGVAGILDHLPPTYTFLRPRFGHRHCWFYGDMEILTYFFGPVGVLLGINLVLFASTARQLTCGLWKREDVKSTTERAALGRVCMKLVVVMGVTWVADVVSWAAGGPHYLWYITDLINALQGIFIFIVVGCQPQVWAAVKRIWCVKKLRKNGKHATGAPLHSSSQGMPSMNDSVTNNTVTVTNNTSTTQTSVKIPMETVC